MIPLFLALISVPPRIGTIFNEDAFVLVGSRWQKAAFSDKRKLQTDESPPSHPAGKYRLEPTVQENEMGEMRAFRVVDHRGKVVAKASEIVGRNMADVRGDVEVLGWGPDGESIVLQRSNSWSAHGTSYEICSLNLRTHKPNRRVEIACSPTVSFILGEKAVLEASSDRESADHPHLYRKVIGHAPVPMRFGRHTICEATLRLSRDHQWALVSDVPLKEFQHYENGERWVMIDVAKGTVRALPPKDTDHHGLRFLY